MDKLKEYAVSLRGEQKHIANLKAVQDDLYEEICETPVGKRWLAAMESVRDAKSKAKAIEAKLRDEAVEVFRVTGEKSLPFGIGIQERVKVAYDDDAAKEWCVDNGKVNLLKLDTTKFKQYAKALSEVEPLPDEIAEIYKEPSATVPSEIPEAEYE